MICILGFVLAGFTLIGIAFTSVLLVELCVKFANVIFAMLTGCAVLFTTFVGLSTIALAAFGLGVLLTY